MRVSKARLFSKRHEKGIRENEIQLDFSPVLRTRIWQVLTDHDYQLRIQRDPNDNWIDNSSVLSEVQRTLLRTYGIEHLELIDGDTNRKRKVELKEFFLRGFPAEMFDVVELTHLELSAEGRGNFQTAVNHVMIDEIGGWLLNDGFFLKIDSAFLDEHVLAPAHEFLRQTGFKGAQEEFAAARTDLDAGNFKGAIQNACKAFESTLKSVEGRTTGNASSLIDELSAVGYYKGLPTGFGPAFGSGVLMALPFLRNRLGGHGQGAEIVEVPESIAKLAVHLSASLISFVVNRKIEINPPTDSVERAVSSSDDLPF